MKYLVQQVIRAAGIVNMHNLVVQNCPGRKAMDSYLGVRHLFDFPCLSSDKRRRYEKISRKKYFNVLTTRMGKIFGEQ